VEDVMARRIAARQELPDIAKLAGVLADPSRAEMLETLLDGKAHSIGALGRRIGITAATASAHLRKLVDAGLVSVTAAGRERQVQLAGADVAELLERLSVLATPARPAGREALRFARTCYDHLAGVLGVLVAGALTDRGWLHDTGDSFEPAPPLFRWLADHGQPVEIGGRRPLSRSCLDWTERVPHVAGRIGTAIASVCLQARWVVPVRESRALRVTDRGRAALARELGLVLPVRRRG
jgi:DNA-binding transcriptional ArsR family regulator